MRSKYAMKNIAMSIFSQIIIILLGFASRKVFIDSLGAEYLGINGVLTNVLSAMVLIESGIGISIVYNLYKPIADGDKEKICALVNLYKKAYRVLAFIMLGISCLLYPFLGYIMKTDAPIKGIFTVYFIFVGKNMISYLNAYKWALINSDQKGYVLAATNLIFQIITLIGKIAIVILTKNYILYLVMELVVFVLQNVVNTIVVHRKYPYIKSRTSYKLDIETTKNIKENVKAMFFHNIGGYLVTSTDNILISAFIGVKTVGLYSNYTMVIAQLGSLMGQIIGGIGAGVGNLIATEDNEKTYSIFKISFMISFWVYSFSTIFLFVLLEPFICWLFGPKFLISKSVFLVVLFNFYLGGIRGPIGTFKGKAGLFIQDKYVSVVEGIINLGTSLLLIKYFGLIGVFIGTTISTLTTVFWSQPRVVYKYLFKQALRSYFIKHIYYLIIMLFTGALTNICCNLVTSGYGFISLCIRGIICVGVVNSVYMVIFRKTDEFKYLFTTIKSLIPSKVKSKILAKVN